jgi:hypothetical protein
MSRIRKDKGGMMKLQEDPEVHGQSIREEKIQRTPKAQPYAPRRPEMLTTDLFCMNDDTEKLCLKTQVEAKASEKGV